MVSRLIDYYFSKNVLVHFKWVENIIGKKGILYVHSCLRDPHISYITIIAAHLRQSAMRGTLELKRKRCILLHCWRQT